MTIDPVEFADMMKHHWTHTLGNIASPELWGVWLQLCQAFNDGVSATMGAELRRWRILQPPTGSGKSQGLAVYAAALAHRAPEAGALIVVRLIAQADEIVSQINRLAGQCVARAKHSSRPLSEEMASSTQVLVVTHAALEAALWADIKGDPRDRLAALMQWQHGLRTLRVIDEALDVVEHGRVEIDQLGFIVGTVPHEIQVRHPGAMAVLAQCRELLAEYRAAKAWGEGEPPRFLGPGTFDDDAQAGIAALRIELQNYDWKHLVALGGSDYARTGARVIELLKSVELIVGDWAYRAISGVRSTLNAARPIIPRGLPGFVVLDATASQNLLWELFEENARLYPVPSNARSYGNVTLHVARCSGVGKGAMVERKATRIPRLAAEMAQRLDQGRKLLVVAHKDVEQDMGGYDYGAQVSFAHWGAIDGLNDYQDDDAVVIFGLHYMPQEWATNTVFAMSGPRDEGWFDEAGNRGWRQHGDIRKELINKQLAAHTVQAINRVRCRRVIDTFGNCAPTDVFLLAPSGAQGDALIDTIRQEMPNIQVKAWAFELDAPSKADQPLPRSRHLEAVLVYLEKCREGIYTPPALQRTLNIPRQSWDKLKGYFLNPEGALLARLHAAKVSIKQSTTPTGKLKLEFVKA